MTERDEFLDVDQESVGRDRGSVEVASGESVVSEELVWVLTLQCRVLLKRSGSQLMPSSLMELTLASSP